MFNVILDDIVAELDSITFTNLILGGDLNCGPSGCRRTWDLLMVKLSRFSLVHVSHAPGAFTFSQETLGNFSCIDHFFTNFTDTTALNVVHVNVIDDHVNFSDHKVIMLFLSGDVRKLCTHPIIDTGADSRTYVKYVPIPSLTRVLIAVQLKL